MMGRILFNTNYMFDSLDNSILTNRLFASTTANALHSMIHILGFDSDLYQFYLNTITGSPLGLQNVIKLTNSNTNFGTIYKSNSYMIITPNVVSEAKKYFGCNTLTGMPL